MLSRNVEATKARNFENYKSHVRNDGTEVLYGVDWLARKNELYERCKGRCEQIITLFDGSGEDRLKGQIRCKSPACDPHHIIRRSKRRDDRLSNLQALCRLHHELLDRRKPKWSKP